MMILHYHQKWKLRPKYTYDIQWSTASPCISIRRLSSSLPLTVINFVFPSLITIPCEEQKSHKIFNFDIRHSRLVASITVSSINMSTCSHPRKPSHGHLSFIIWINVFKNSTNKKHDVGEPCRSPIVAEIIAVPRILLVTLYIEVIANHMSNPQPTRFNVSIILSRGTRSYA